MKTEKGIYTEPSSTAAFNGVIHPSFGIPVYPLQKLDLKGSLIKIDNKAYYEGKYRRALDVICRRYQRHVVADIGFPEALESTPHLLFEEIR